MSLTAMSCTENEDSSSEKKASSESRAESSSYDIQYESENYKLALEAYAQGNYSKAKELIEQISENDKNYDKAQLLLEQIKKSLLEESSESSDERIPDNDFPPVMTDSIEPIPDGAEAKLVWLSYYDLNPATSIDKKRAELQLFETKGGSIEYVRTTYTDRFDKLEEYIISDKEVDMFPFSTTLEFPAYSVKGLFNPIDEVTNFNDPIWSDVRNIADSFMINGRHYLAPIDVFPSSVLVYDRSKIEENGLDDPYELYQNGEWNWDTWYDIMEAYCSENKDSFGINGYFAPMIFNSTGHSIVEFEKSRNAYVNNIDDPSFDKAAELFSRINSNGLYTDAWYGCAEDAFHWNILFYAMGTWASSGINSPGNGDNWGLVPIPSEPGSDTSYQTAGIESYMWVKGSEKKEAMKCWLECARTVNSNAEFLEAEKENFMNENPNWTEEMYSVGFPDNASFIVDPYYGLTNNLSDNESADNEYKEAILEMLYRGSLTKDNSGDPVTWDSMKKEYSPVIDEELEKLNKSIKEMPI